jgi:hypothetical protein
MRRKAAHHSRISPLSMRSGRVMRLWMSEVCARLSTPTKYMRNKARRAVR